MKISTLFLTGLSVLCFISCIKDEPLYREADITSFIIEGEAMISSSISENQIQLVVSDDADYKNLTPNIVLSPGAIVTPASGETIDFTDDVVYKVISEDGNYSKEYTVNVSSRISTEYDFEEWQMAGALWKYPALKDISWTSANVGIAVAKFGKVDRYPTRDTTDAHSGQYAAVLETLKGIQGSIYNVPIFSGSLFRGEFKLQNPEFLKSPRFGQIHPKESGKPIAVTGYYKYKRGPEFIDSNNQVVPGRLDECSIYAVLFKVTKGAGKDEFLYGDNVLTDENIIAKAILEDGGEKEEYTEFNIPFEYSKEMDYTQHDYKLTVVFASSKRGDYYEGAPGSMLIVDDVEVICEAFKE
ncbi:MAG: PCMD domain-containing protein [Dysgonomonas sp.]|nr:PCMD domain-containing protein [Dysgonomonas sp.]